MTKQICIVDGHPDPSPARYIHALCDAYEKGAVDSGHGVDRINVAELKPSPLLEIVDFNKPPAEIYLLQQEKVMRADHLVLAFPLWLGSMPAATRALFEQMACGGFFLQEGEGVTQWPRKMMKGKSARIIITMGMPAIVYRTLMGSASVKALERGMFGISGFKPIKHSILGGVESSNDKRVKWLEDIYELGKSAS